MSQITIAEARPPMITKIISGGQTGADRAALDFAIAHNIPHGGWIPKGRKTEEGPLPDKYQLQEMPTRSYVNRTEKNILDSDGTLVVSHGKLTGGSALTRELAKKHKKPCIHMDLDKVNPSEATCIIAGWIKKHHITVMNVAGARASKDSKIYQAIFDLLEAAILPA